MNAPACMASLLCIFKNGMYFRTSSLHSRQDSAPQHAGNSQNAAQKSWLDGREEPAAEATSQEQLVCRQGQLQHAWLSMNMCYLPGSRECGHTTPAGGHTHPSPSLDPSNGNHCAVEAMCCQSHPSARAFSPQPPTARHPEAIVLKPQPAHSTSSTSRMQGLASCWMWQCWCFNCRCVLLRECCCTAG